MSENKTMSTQDFRTKTLMIPVKNPTIQDCWGVAVDVGYSGTKIFSPNMVACFPTFAMRQEGVMLNLGGGGMEDLILYRDNIAAKPWVIGKRAQDMLSTDDVDKTSMAIYNRNRYDTPDYKYSMLAGIAIGSRNNQFGGPNGKRVYLQTGLPNAFLKSDSKTIREIYGKKHVFDLKIGSGKWEHFEFDFTENDIFVMPQPLGTILSVLTTDDGHYTADASQITGSNSLIIDPGFRTTDTITMKNLTLNYQEMNTYEQFSMMMVLQHMADILMKNYTVEIPVPAMQSYLEKGSITVMKTDKTDGSVKRRAEIVDITPFLEASNREIARMAIDKIINEYHIYDDSGMTKFQNIVLTGGTGDAWFDYFKEEFAWNPNIQILKGNRTNNLPCIFSNVRGYYFYLISNLKSMLKAQRRNEVRNPEEQAV